MITRFNIPAAAMGKPRMTQRDKWYKRDRTDKYWRWCEVVRAFVNPVPPAETVEQLEIIAYYMVPKSWSKKKRHAAIGTRKRTVPDHDNILKGILDALWKQDAALGDCIIRRRWRHEDKTVIIIDVTEHSEVTA